MKERLQLEKRQQLRNNEYYTMQQILDNLYKDSCNNRKFTDLMKYISSENNIMLAYRNIKKNKGSTTGTHQCEINSPLLANIVLNELDWWLSSQWETFQTESNYTTVRETRIDQSYKYKKLRKTKLKEIYFVRYVDDSKIFCKDWKTAQKIFNATRKWLDERLGLETSPEKSKITNLRRNYTEF